MRVAVAAVVAGALITAAPTGAGTRLVYLGVKGSPSRFAALTGQQSVIRHVFIGFDQGPAVSRVVAGMTPVPMLALVPGSYGSREVGTPRSIALGGNDAFLFDVNAAIASFHGPLFYLRPFPEMNGYWESNCAYNQNGTRRPAFDSTAWSRKAFARIAVIVRGGTAADIDAKLARLHLPGIGRDLPVTTPKLQLVWNPQGFGAPDVPGNSANAYYPGNAYVDVVADDLYDIAGHGATWAAAQKLYDAHPSKPFGFGEWGLWGIDDPAFVRAMAAWVHRHRRLVLLSFFNYGKGSIWDIHSKPRSAAAYRKYISPLG
jgi:hypothetical protein